MSKYIKDHSLSVGYNNTGQEFFDILYKYEKYIHSYFFSFSESMTCDKYNVIEVIDKLEKSNTYGIPANILFNTRDDKSIIFFINLAKSFLNLTSITLFDLKNIKFIKNEYPYLSIHLSVRYFDWNNNSIDDLLQNIIKDDLYKYIDAINISGNRSFNDHELINVIHSLGIKVKFITNESCIINRSNNYSNFKNFEKLDCVNSQCNKYCLSIISKYPWMELARINLIKEMLQYYDIDILKISSRNIYDNEYIRSIIDYWITDENTKNIYPPDGTLDISKHYDMFLEWCKEKSFCRGNCVICKKCKKYYDIFIK